MYQSHERLTALIRHTFSPHCLQLFRPLDHFNIQSVPFSIPALRLWMKREGHKRKGPPLIRFSGNQMQNISLGFCQIPPTAMCIQTKKKKIKSGKSWVFSPSFLANAKNQSWHFPAWHYRDHNPTFSSVYHRGL